MNNYRPYAAGVIISLGVFVTGILWHERSNPYIAAEDIASLANDAWLRYAVMFTYSDQNPEEAFIAEENSAGDRMLNKTNTVDAARLQSLVRRTLNTMRSHFYPGPPIWFEVWPYARWMQDELITGSDPIVEIVDGYSATTNYNYSGIHSNHMTIRWSPRERQIVTARLPRTLDTRNVDNIDVMTTEMLAYSQPTNLPVYDKLLEQYGDFDRNMKPITNWWQENISTNLYSIDFAEIYTNNTIKPRNAIITTNLLDIMRDISDAMHTAAVIGFEGTAQQGTSMWRYDAKTVNTNITELHQQLRTNGVVSTEAQLPDPASTMNNYWQQLGALYTDTMPVISSGGYLMAGQIQNLIFDGLINYQSTINNYFDYEAEHFDPLSIGPFYDSTETHSFEVRGRILPTLNNPLRIQYHGVYCLWPPDWAFSAGIVKRLKYYAIFTNISGFGQMFEPMPVQMKPDWPYRGLLPDGGNNWYVPEYLTYYDSQSQDTSTAWTGGTESSNGYILSEFGNPVKTFTSDQARHDTIRTEVNNQPSKLRANLLLDVSYPTSRPKLENLGPGNDHDPITHNAWLHQLSASEARETEAVSVRLSGGTAKGVQTLRSRNFIETRFRQQLYLYKLICVAEFDFTAYSDNKTTPHTPPWAEE